MQIRPENIKKTIKPLPRKGFIVCGAGGSRTRVQTLARYAFYALISALIVGSVPGQNEPTYSLSAMGFGRPHAAGGSLSCHCFDSAAETVNRQTSRRL